MVDLVVFLLFNRVLPQWSEEFHSAFKIIRLSLLPTSVCVTKFDKNIEPKTNSFTIYQKGHEEKNLPPQNKMISAEHYKELLICIVLLICEYFKFVCACTFFQSRTLHLFNLWKGFFFFPVKTKSIFYLIYALVIYHINNCDKILWYTSGTVFSVLSENTL